MTQRFLIREANREEIVIRAQVKRKMSGPCCVAMLLRFCKLRIQFTHIHLASVQTDGMQKSTGAKKTSILFSTNEAQKYLLRDK